MAKGLRCKVKKRFRTVKRGVVKQQLRDPESKLGRREVQKEAKLREALSGDIKPGTKVKNAFRSDDPDAVIPQHEWRQGADFRSGRVEDSGFAVWGSNRPKLGSYGGDAPTARPTPATTSMEAEQSTDVADAGVARLLRSSEQLLPIFASKKVKRRMKKKSEVETTSVFRWT